MLLFKWCLQTMEMRTQLMAITIQFIFMDMIFSFWRLTPITKAHKQVEPLLDVGLAFKCNCPRFMHYHTCKHALALSLHFEKVAVPLKFSVETAGKRNATAGASLSRRAMCLVVDN